MKRTIIYLLIAITGNALGTAIMNATNLGMTAWGSAASNTANLIGITIGQAFFVLSVLFYGLATIIRKKFILKEMIESFLFQIGFMLSSDTFISWMPSLEGLNIWLLLVINVIGMLILMFSIAVHVRLHRFVHPMDVYLHVLQKKLNSISWGTYIAYLSGFAVAILCGLLASGISDIGYGTAITLVTSGIVMKFYNEKILDHWKFD